MKKEENQKSAETMSKFFQKASNIGRKAADGIQKSAKSISEKAKNENHLRRVKKYNPIFPKDYKSKKFNLPNIIEIVDDAERRDIDVCKGAIGWCDTINNVEIFHLYDEWIKESGIQFIPVAKCNDVYCVDPFDRNRFIKSDYIFGKANEEKLAELEQIAYCLGAKCCSIDIVEAMSESKNNSQKIIVGTQIQNESSETQEVDKINSKQNSINYVNGSTNFQRTLSSAQSNHRSGHIVSSFEGNSSPHAPNLKWFAHDDNIRGLIEMRCSSTNSIKSKTLELSGASCSTMSRKTACAVDLLLKSDSVRSKGHATVSMESQVIKECSNNLVFRVEF